MERSIACSVGSLDNQRIEDPVFTTSAPGKRRTERGVAGNVRIEHARAPGEEQLIGAVILTDRDVEASRHSCRGR